jgi:[ribosomal protein S18]-alanine N-acetyltransferase
VNEDAIEVRRFRRPDVDAVTELEKLVFPDPWTKNAFRREAEGSRGSWSRVAVDTATGSLIGYMVAWVVADETHLANLAVAPGARRRGVAQKMLDDLTAESERRGVRMIVLEVRRSNVAAQTLYRRNGFYTTMIRREYYRDNREDALVMVKPLNEAGRIPPLAGGHD